MVYFVRIQLFNWAAVLYIGTYKQNKWVQFVHAPAGGLVE